MDEKFLKGLEQEFSQGFQEIVVSVAGHKWKMRTLDGIESVWRDRYVDFGGTASFLSSRKIPTLAIAIREIDGRPIEVIFEDYDNVEEKKNVNLPLAVTEFESKKFTAAEKFRKWLGEKVSSTVTDELWSHYQKLEETSLKAIQEVLSPEGESFRGETTKE